MTESMFDTEAVETIWNFLCRPSYDTASDKRCDFVLAHGNLSYVETVTRAAEVIKEQDSQPFLVCSGLGPRGDIPYYQSEAIRMRHLAIKLGIDRYRTLIEPWSTSTGDNLLRTKDLLERSGIVYDTAGVVVLPFAIQRVEATFGKVFPEVKCLTTTFMKDWMVYTKRRMENDPVRLIKAMRGEVNRLNEYPSRGFTIPVVIPENVKDAHMSLSAFGAR